ncbi:hypothetical protein BCR39DRAFT_518307 [Naematelia encephala]|uniref:DUF1772-domain-containing protein n=1 Tax=Naematelia encephala TaxID=71784 RepID=A0A1Y2BGX0_9TREE|nr:hypothetical protein BCR39DRAFT_518307 [Naematelia encephala]
MFGLPDSTVVLTGGLISTSYVLFSNLGMSQIGIIPLINGRLGEFHLPARERAKAWSLYFKQAAPWTIGPSVVGAGLNFAAAYMTSSPFIRQLAITAGITGLTIVPYTLTFIHGINLQLHAINNEDKLRDVPESHPHAKQVGQLTTDWEKRHWVRFVAYGGAFALNLAALLAQQAR